MKTCKDGHHGPECRDKYCQCYCHNEEDFLQRPICVIKISPGSGITTSIPGTISISTGISSGGIIGSATPSNKITIPAPATNAPIAKPTPIYKTSTTNSLPTVSDKIIAL